MAGGMNRGQHGGSLADRAARSGVPVPPAADTLRSDTPRSDTPRSDTPRSAATEAEGAPAARRPAGEGHGRHCWVHDPPDAPGTWPGLLVEWRQREGSWHGRVAYTVIGRHGPVLVEAWLPAAQLEQG